MKRRHANRLRGLALGAASLGLSASSCVLLSRVDRSEIYPTGEGAFAGNGGEGGAAGQAGGEGGTAGQAGAGGLAECQTSNDCTPSINECLENTCLGGACVMTNAPAGKASMSQIPADCHQNVCDGTGALVTVDDNTDVENDGKDCTLDLCSMGNAMHPLQPQGAPCAEQGGKVCNSKGTCVECNVGGDCMSGVCQESLCRPAECGNGSKDGAETDIDCAGSCGACADGKACILAEDCQSHVCVAQVCAAATCDDGVSNGAETDVDCGGSCPNPCADGKGCATDADCQNGACNTMTLTCATCTDGIQNASETDIDCGGNCPNDCDSGKACLVDADCKSAMCHANKCWANVNECDVATATDLTASQSVTIVFQLFYYSPKCIKVKQGTVLTFSGDFTESPLQGGVVLGGLPMAASTGPFVPVTTSGNTKDFTMEAPGTYPYYCIIHGTLGMNGAVFVVP